MGDWAAHYTCGASTFKSLFALSREIVTSLFGMPQSRHPGGVQPAGLVRQARAKADLASAIRPAARSTPDLPRNAQVEVDQVDMRQWNDAIRNLGLDDPLRGY